MIAAWRNAMLESRALRGAVAQLGERRVRNAKVEGSIPFRSTNPLLPRPAWPLSDEVPVGMPGRIAQQWRDNHHAHQEGHETQRRESDDEHGPYEHRRQVEQGGAQ